MRELVCSSSPWPRIGGAVVSLQPGDRVRWETTDADGLPVVNYGFVGEDVGNRVRIMLDGSLKGDTLVAAEHLQIVSVTTVALRLPGSDILDKPALRQGLVQMWNGEAEQAGLEIRAVQCMGSGVRHTRTNSYVLAEVRAGGQRYVLKAWKEADDTVTVQPELG